MSQLSPRSSYSLRTVGDIQTDIKTNIIIVDNPSFIFLLLVLQIKLNNL